MGFSAGYSRHRADFYVRPKRLWLRTLDAQTRRHLCAVSVPADCTAGVIAPPSGVLPLSRPQMLSLEEVLRLAPDLRAKNARFRLGPVLTLIAMALLAGRRDIAEIARFVSILTSTQRHQLGLPRKAGTTAFYQVPGYAVFYQVLTRLDPVASAELLGGWLQTRAGLLPQALALDGKMIRDHIGLLTLAQHEDGAPQAVAIYDQKKAPSVANNPPPPVCCTACRRWTTSWSQPTRCTARRRRPALSRKRAVTICSKSRATNPRCSPRPRCVMPSPTRPFFSHRSRPRTRRHPRGPRLRG